METNPATIDLDLWMESNYPIEKLWAMVLLLALKDRARCVNYNPALGDMALTYEVDGVEYAMVPPPDFMAKEIEKQMRDALVPPPLWRRLIGRWLSLVSVDNRAAYLKLGAIKALIRGTTDPENVTVSLFFTAESPLADAARNALDRSRARTREAEV